MFGRLGKPACCAALAVTLTALPAACGSQTGCGGSTVCIAARPSTFTPSRIELQAGKTVTLRFAPTLGVHSLYFPQLGIDHTLIDDGKVTDVVLTPKKSGVYVMHCRIFCGVNHPNMQLTIVVKAAQ